MLFVGTSIIHPSTEGVFLLCNILDLLIYSSKINETKKRVKNEFEKYGAFCWITKGKEIENYLEKEAIEEAFGKKIGKQCEQYQLFPEYIEPICSTFKKVEFAQKVVPYVIQERASKMLDLEKQVKSLYAVIKKWNQK